MSLKAIGHCHKWKNRVKYGLMKTLKAVLLLFTVAAVLFAASVIPPTGEVVIQVNPSTNLNAAKLHVISGRLRIDPDHTKWLQEMTIEAWNDEEQPETVARKILTLTFQQMKNLYNSTNPSLTLQNSALNKANLTLKQP